MTWYAVCPKHGMFYAKTVGQFRANTPTGFVTSLLGKDSKVEGFEGPDLGAVAAHRLEQNCRAAVGWEWIEP